MEDDWKRIKRQRTPRDEMRCREISDQQQEIERLRTGHEAVRKEVFDTQYAGLSYRDNAENLCAKILRLTHEALGSVIAPGEPDG